MRHVLELAGEVKLLLSTLGLSIVSLASLLVFPVPPQPATVP